MIIGVTGPMASGKNEFGKILGEHGFSRLSLSDLVREEAKKRGMPIERGILQDIGNDLRETYGVGILAELALKRIDNGNCVIDGIRNPGEIDVLKKRKDFLLVGVDANTKVRFERVKERIKDSDPKNWEEFLTVETRDREEGGKGQAVDACMSLADITLENNGSREEFHRQIEQMLKSRRFQEFFR